ncbi:MAG: hypothetical protein JNK15_05560 [Planctomycetes bacterium]|nr:hypothetical protein [Planctomycetota bacterium]
MPEQLLLRSIGWRLLIVLLMALAAVPAQGDPGEPKAPPTLDAATTQALERLATLLAEKAEARAAAHARGDTATAAAIDVERKALEWQFAGLASRLDVQEFEAPAARRFDLQQEIEQLVRPLLQNLKEATAGPRRISELRERIELLQARQRIAEAAQRAAERTRDLLPAGGPARLRTELELAQRWRPAITTMRDEITVLTANLEQLQDAQKSVLQAATEWADVFVRTSGTSLLLCILVFAAVFFGLRHLADRLVGQGRDRGFVRRLVHVLARILVALVAVAATLVVPYTRNDWFLLAVGIVFLLGAGWVVMRMLPQLFEQIRLMLNVGGVREGERLIVDGLPFQIAALRFYTRLENPDLVGGVLRVPLQFLVGKRSRRSAPDEPWFPCRVGDVVLLADGSLGPVRTQTPEVVVVEHLGAPRSYPTVKFLELSPRNLSRGFVVDASFVVARELLPAVTTTVCERLEPALRAAIAQVVDPSLVRGLQVQFAAVTKDGLELVALCDCDGALAAHWFTLRRTMARAFVDACRAHGWSLPPPVSIATAN